MTQSIKPKASSGLWKTLALVTAIGGLFYIADAYECTDCTTNTAKAATQRSVFPNTVNRTNTISIPINRLPSSYSSYPGTTSPISQALRDSISNYRSSNSQSYSPQSQIDSSSDSYRIGAICNDGWRSTATGRGACSWHGGVSYWLYN